MRPIIAGILGFVAGVIATLVVIVIWALATTPSTSSAPDQLTLAYEACDTSSEMSLGDDGSTLIFDTEGEEDFSGSPVEEVACVFLALDLPDSIMNQIERTTALAGNQSADWNDFNIQWSYHPDRGLSGMITVDEE